MTKLEKAKKADEFYRGTSVEVMTYETVENLSEDAKFRICYANCIKNFDMDDVSMEEYIEMTRNDFEENEDCYIKKMKFSEFLNDLTYSYINEIWGTPLSLV